MAKAPEFPLLRLDPPKAGARRPGRPGFQQTRKFAPGDQAGSPVGRKLEQLARALETRDPLTLRADASGLAPERLLVFELTGGVQNFMRALARVPGLEFVGAEDLEADDVDKDPSLYLMVPNAAALRQMVGLWTRFRSGQPLADGFAPWRDLFAQLRDLRPWGPQDRLTPQDAEVIAEEAARGGSVRLELELVFRPDAAGVERDARQAVGAAGGEVLSGTRIDGAKYHALLVDVPAAEAARVLQRGAAGLVSAESVMHIRPQSVVHITVVEADEGDTPPGSVLPTRPPIVAVFDAVPLAGHPRLQDRIEVEDPFDLEPLAVGVRIHGTAMASAVVHGDLGAPPLEPLERRVLFLNIMYAPPDPGADERFPTRLPADLFQEAVVRLREGGLGPGVVAINASVGDRNKPFMGRMSGWARVLDHLAHAYGLLFIVSAGNHLDDLETAGMDANAFEALDNAGRARVALEAVGAAMASRRVLAPSESMNALTVGALHTDSAEPAPPQAYLFDVWADTGLSTVSSALGPGIGNSIKPDVLAPGGRHHVRLQPSGTGHRLRPLGKNAGAVGGIRVASPGPPAAANPDHTSRTVGTSVAAALMTGLAARVHEGLEAVYDDFGQIPIGQRAALIKAFLVHTATWTPAHRLIADVLGPQGQYYSARRKDNVRRFLGYGAVNGAAALACATDRATLWATGRLARDQAHEFVIPLPEVMSGKARPHSISATLAWFAPPRIAASSYRGVRLAIVEPKPALSTFAVGGAREQPDFNQAHRGTVVHRRWEGEKAAALVEGSTFDLAIQRQPDDLDELVPYGFVVTITMPGVAEVYAQVRARLSVRPRVAVPT